MKRCISMNLEQDEVLEACNDYIKKILGDMYVSMDSIDISQEETKDKDGYEYVAFMSVYLDFDKK